MKKKADPMFRKAQLKLFSLITVILLAVFVGLLASVNIITKVVMDHQSEFVLKQIAASLEYNDVDNYFTLSRPEDYEPRQDDIWNYDTWSNDSWYDYWNYFVPENTIPPQESTLSETTSSSGTSDNTTETTGGSQSSASSGQSGEGNRQNQQSGKSGNNNGNNTPQQSRPSESSPTNPSHENSTEGTQPNNWWDEWKKYTDPSQWSQQDWGTPGQQGGWSTPGQQGGQQGQQPVYTQPPNQGQDWNQWGQGQDWNQWGWPWGGVPSYGNENKSKESKQSEDKKESSGLAYEDIYGGGIVPLGNPATTQTETQTTTSSSSYTNAVTTTTWMQVLQDSWVNGEHYDEYGRRIKPIPTTMGDLEFFAIMSDKNGQFKATLNNFELDDDQAQDYINRIIAMNVQDGMIDNYQFCSMSKQNGTLIVFTDKSEVLDVLNYFKRITIIIGIISIIFFAIAAYFLSKKSIEPIKIAFDRQKQFVSDASHELKTPLTVISTNADVLEGEIGENRWLSYIKSQTDRMSVLVNDLLNLTRLDSNSSQFLMTEFDLSKAIENTALPFECQAFDQNKKFIIDVDKGITITGSEQHIKQMAAIFIDNALKYSNDGGTVKVMLKKQGEKKIFSVYNTGQGVKEEDKFKIFERFYRSDESRNRATGGYGLGLAIAKSIIDKHKFKINVLNQEGKSICFVVSM